MDREPLFNMAAEIPQNIAVLWGLNLASRYKHNRCLPVGLLPFPLDRAINHKQFGYLWNTRACIHWAVRYLSQVAPSFKAARSHYDVIKWKHFPRYWPFVKGIHRSPVDSPHKGQWRGALMFLWCAPEQRLSKQLRRRWFKTPSHSLWRQYNGVLR